MNKTNLKRYAPQARKDFIAAVTARAQLLGLSEVAGQPYAEPCQLNGDVAVIAGRPWPASVHGKRERLIQRMKRDGYAATLDAVAYTWFNRFAALRYMEVHDYLGHGRRVLSNPDGALPEVLSHALELAEAGELPGLQAEQVRQLKLDNQDGELFRRVLIAQCNALHGAMPFLFEAIDDETELLLPDNLLLSDSVVANLVSEIPEEDWTEVEAIGWLYQFYISEKKDEVIGKVVKSEDIPAATQLFTPNWIVQYLVQNSVGRLWLMANPDSTLASLWPYYIQPAEQTPEVQAQLDSLIQTRIREDGDALNPETITVLDPACGSGHILVVAYDVLKAIYLERGYQPRAIPRLILEKNLYGLDIDDRAAQMAGFAMLMKARADDRRLFNDPPQLNMLSLQQSKGLDVEELTTHLAPFGLQRAALTTLIETFEHAKTFGSLIQVPEELSAQLPSLMGALDTVKYSGDLYAQAAAQDVLQLIKQASVLGRKFDGVVANPPYMGGKGMNAALKDLAKTEFPESKSDLFAMFIERGFRWCKPSGFNSMITMQSWMFLSAFKKLREKIIDQRTVSSLVYIGYNSFPSMNSKIAQACAHSFFATKIIGNVSSYVNLNTADASADKNLIFLESCKDLLFQVNQERFKSVPGSPFAFWISDSERDSFLRLKSNGDYCETSNGVQTGDNDKYVREWFEVALNKIPSKWVPYNKGGPYRKWFGNATSVIDWSEDGEVIKNNPNSSLPNKSFLFKSCLTWTDVTWRISARFLPEGYLSDHAGPCAFYQNQDDLLFAMGVMNTPLADEWSKILNPTLHFQAGDYKKIPVAEAYKNEEVKSIIKRAIDISKHDWDSQELSRDFSMSPLVGAIGMADAYSKHLADSEEKFAELLELEERNLSQVMQSFGINDRAGPTILRQWITISSNPLHRFSAEETSIELMGRYRYSIAYEFVSYSIGCMMGRYSLDEPGLIYANAGNVGFDATRYQTFSADADGIVPITDDRWFEDDAANRVREFLSSVWSVDTLKENMTWLAESLGTKVGETPDETVRRYLADKFFKDHLQTYKKRPIYWLFSSGKLGAFKALVYLHRYHEGTLARMRSEYVLPLTGKMQARMESLEVDIRQASSTAARNKLTKQLDALRKQHHELLSYDEKLRHYADQRISIDLDDGVKVNYGKFGDLLAEVKAVTGGAGDE